MSPAPLCSCCPSSTTTDDYSIQPEIHHTGPLMFPPPWVCRGGSKNVGEIARWSQLATPPLQPPCPGRLAGLCRCQNKRETRAASSPDSQPASHPGQQVFGGGASSRSLETGPHLADPGVFLCRCALKAAAVVLFIYLFIMQASFPGYAERGWVEPGRS